jgi:MerR family mercuric resistance operon transcriptional regulator
MGVRANEQRQAEAQPLKIGEVSKLTGIGIEALRFYERSGLLGRPRRTASGYRLYEPAVVDRLAFIKRAQVLGFTLDEIKRLIAEKQAGHSPCEEVREIVRHRLEDLDARLKEMKRYRKDLGETLARWDEAGALDGAICGLIEGTNVGPVSSDSRTLKRKRATKRPG